MKRGTIALLLGVLLFCPALPSLAQDAEKIDTKVWRGIQLQNERGEKVPLDKLRRPVTFMVLWASWCKPCIHHLPDVQALEKRVAQDKSVRILVVNVDGPEMPTKDVRKILQKKVPGLTLYRDPQKQLMKAILKPANLVESLPLTAVLNKQGQLGAMIGAADLDQRKQLKDWVEWIGEAKRGELPDSRRLPVLKLTPKPPTPVSPEGEIVNMDYPKDMPAAELAKEMQQVRLSWKKRYAYLTPEQVETLIHEIENQKSRALKTRRSSVFPPIGRPDRP
ncbi:MAG: TlpA family protein disulfide reductase [Deltaproteobacteria bacterium]|nr:TlpA family protein disulfide reductase [Deltaproteobacteria bacterium]